MKIFSFLIVILACLSCQNPSDTATAIDYSNVDEIKEQKINSDVLSFSKRSGDDIIQHLYKESLSKDPQLKQLDNQIARMQGMRNDSLSSINEYIDYNKLYYSSINKYVYSIKDSIKRNAIKSILSDSEDKSNMIISNYDSDRKRAIDLENTFNDQYFIMQLLISESLIQAYQKNEPDIRSIKNLNLRYQELIDQTEKYTEPLINNK